MSDSITFNSRPIISDVAYAHNHFIIVISLRYGQPKNLIQKLQKC